jgi:hypothetical protein
MSLRVVRPPFSWENTIPLTVTCRATTAFEASIFDWAMEDISPFPFVDDVPSHENIEPIFCYCFFMPLWSSFSLILIPFTFLTEKHVTTAD